MMSFTRIATATVLSFGLTAQTVTAQQSLGEVGYVTEGMIAIGIALEISEVCPDIGARKIRGLGYINQLRNHARGLGYSNEQIEEFRKDKTEKARLKVIGRQRLVNMGAPRGDVAAHCAVGRAEIAKETTIGYLLRG
jgi:hypothetical protein